MGGSAVDFEPAARLGCESMDLAEPQSRLLLGRGVFRDVGYADPLRSRKREYVS